MKKFLHRLKLVGIACALASGLGVGITAATAFPAFAANGPCYDIAIANPTPLHQWPSGKSLTVKYLPRNSTVTGTCYYSNNLSEGMWFMQVNYTGPNNNQGYGYIWVQRLQYGSGHACKYEYGAIHGIGSGYCPLENYYGP